MTKTYVQQSLRDRDEHRLFQQEWSIEAVTGLICRRMEEEGVTRAELARRMGVSPGWVTQFLDGESNKTVRTLSDAFFALDRSLEFHDRPLKEVVDSMPKDSTKSGKLFVVFDNLNVTNEHCVWNTRPAKSYAGLSCQIQGVTV